MFLIIPMLVHIFLGYFNLCILFGYLDLAYTFIFILIKVYCIYGFTSHVGSALLKTPLQGKLIHTCAFITYCNLLGFAHYVNYINSYVYNVIVTSVILMSTYVINSQVLSSINIILKASKYLVLININKLNTYHCLWNCIYLWMFILHCRVLFYVCE
jgi:hypothetical protein